MSTIGFLQATERFKTSLFNSVPNEMVPLAHCQLTHVCCMYIAQSYLMKNDVKYALRCVKW